MGGGYFLLSAMGAMTEGSYSNMIDIFTRDHTGHVQIHQGNYLHRPSLYKTLNNPNELIKALEDMPQVVAAAPRIYAPSLAYGKQKSYPANVVGIDPALEANTSLLKQKLSAGQYLTKGMNPDGYFSAMLGATLAKNLKLNIGDELILISQGIDGSIANDIFMVSGIVGNKNSFEALNVYLSLDAMASFLSMHNRVHELTIRLQSQEMARDFASHAKELKPILGQNEISIDPWQVVESSFYHGMQADKKGNYVSMGVIIFIVAIGVLNTILMGTLERTHEFGVLKAIGTRPMGVFNLIMIESGILAGLSCLLGAICVLPLNYWMANTGIQMPEAIDMGGIAFDVLRGEISWFSMGMPALVVMFSTLAVSIVPAIRAANISPVQAMRES